MKHAKLLLCVCLTLTLLLCIPLSAHATLPGGDTGACPYSNNGGHEWMNDRDQNPTCTEPGYYGYRCALCGAVTQVEVPALGHAYQQTAKTEPTCTEPGSITYTCARCQDSYTETVPALGHAVQFMTAELPTCTEPGVEKQTCWRCGVTFDMPLPPEGHSFKEEYTKAPTCTEPGEVLYTCTRCGYSYTDVAPATGHDYVRVHTQPACIEDGYDTLTCVICGESHTETVPAAGHHIPDPYNPFYIIAPTCTRDGEQFSFCIVCGHRDSTVLPALGHDWDDGRVIPPKHGQEPKTVYTCRRCGETRYESLQPGGGKQDSGLRVIRQPEGGTLTPGGSLRLTVGVAGGRAPYSYQWFSRDILGSEGLLNDALTGRFGPLGKPFAGRYSRFSDLFEPLRVEPFTAKTPGSLRFPGNVLGGSRKPIDGENSDVCRVYEGNCAYFCVITDADHNRVVSAEAVVTWAGSTAQAGKGSVTVDDVAGSWHGKAFGLRLGLDLNTNGSYELSFAGVPEAAAAGTWELADGAVLLDGRADEPLTAADGSLTWADTGLILGREEAEPSEPAPTTAGAAERFNGCWQCVDAVVDGVPLSGEDLGAAANIVISAPMASLGGDLFGDVSFTDMDFAYGALRYEGEGFTAVLTLLEDGRLRLDVSGASEGDLTLLFARV